MRGSRIDPTKPMDGTPAAKADLRANLRAAKAEIEELQRAAVPWRRITGDHTLGIEDLTTTLVVDGGGDVTIRCPAGLNTDAGALRWVKVIRGGAGAVTFAAGDGVTLLSPGGRTAIPERYGAALVSFMDARTVRLEGV